jgi:hypothetical protein
LAFDFKVNQRTSTVANSILAKAPGRFDQLRPEVTEV